MREIFKNKNAESHITALNKWDRLMTLFNFAYIYRGLEMSQTKTIFKFFFNGAFLTIYGYNLFDLIIDKVYGVQPKDLISESIQTGLAVIGIMFAAVKLIDFLLQMVHRFKMNKLERESKIQEIKNKAKHLKYFQELNDIKKEKKTEILKDDKQSKG